jgi:hypothetical protein
MNKDDDCEDELDSYYNKWLAERGKFKRAAEKIASQNAGLVALTSRLEAAERVVSVLTDHCAECNDHLAAAIAEAERFAAKLKALGISDE